MRNAIYFISLFFSAAQSVVYYQQRKTTHFHHCCLQLLTLTWPLLHRFLQTEKHAYRLFFVSNLTQALVSPCLHPRSYITTSFAHRLCFVNRYLTSSEWLRRFQLRRTGWRERQVQKEVDTLLPLDLVQPSANCFIHLMIIQDVLKYVYKRNSV